MNIQRDEDTLTISGMEELTAANAGVFQKSITDQLSPSIKKLHLMADNMKLMDSTGLGVLIIIHTRLAQNGGQITISHPTGIVEQLLKMTRLNQVFQIERP